MFFDDFPNQYLNCIARLLVIIDSFPLPINQLFALHDFKKLEDETCDEFDTWWEQEKDVFLYSLMSKITLLETSTEQNKYIVAYVLCDCMDDKITYSNSNSPGKVSLHSLVPVSKGNPIILKEPLNKNYIETHIAIHPKFDVYDICERFHLEDGSELIEKRPAAIKDAFSGINGQLKNISYTKYRDVDISVIDVVVDPPGSFKDDCLTIAFSPMTNQDVVGVEDELISVEGITFDASRVIGVLPECVNKMIERFDFAWLRASSMGADIIFFPEAMGLQTLENIQCSHHIHIKKLGETAMEEGYNPPKITFLPSYCGADRNTISVAYQNGQHLGMQNKQWPYVDRKKHKMEAFGPMDIPEIVVLHMPGVHRMAIMICSDFLTCSVEIQQKLFADLGISLLLVTSYTKGEQDFITKLTEFKKYGTTVIWGNCCAATENNRIKGGCSIATLDKIHRFSECNECNNKCEKGCIFLVKIPLHFNRNLKEEILVDEVVKQVLL